MSRGLLVCITGIDGAGKTTAARGLVEDLRRHGVAARYEYTRYVPVLLRPLLWGSRLLFLRKEDQFRDYARHRDTKKGAAERHPVLSLVYRSVMLVDYAAQILFKVAIPRALGRHVVCDRYVYDTVVTDLYVDFGYSLADVVRISKRFMRFAPKPDLIVFIDAPPAVAFARKDDVPSVEYLEERYEAYATLADALDMLRVDGTRESSVVGQEIYRQTVRPIAHD